jgi:hypothetical protein
VSAEQVQATMGHSRLAVDIDGTGAYLLVRVFIERHAANRWVRITVELADYFGAAKDS